MKYLAMFIPVVLLAACAGIGSSGSGAAGAGAAYSEEYNRDVRDAVTRGTTQGINPL